MSGPRGAMSVAGFLAGLTVTAEYTGVLALIPLGGYAMTTVPGGWSGGEATLYALLGLLPPVLALATYHQVAFGHPLTSGYRFLNDVGYQSWHQGGFLGIKLPNASALVQSFFSPLRGLFTLSPMLLLALPRLFDPRSLRRNPELCLAWPPFSCMPTSPAASATLHGLDYGAAPPDTPRAVLAVAAGTLPPLAGESPRPGRESALGAGAGRRGSSGPGGALHADDFRDDPAQLHFGHLHQRALSVALPLALRGFLPHTWLSLLGVPNPWAALPAMALPGSGRGACAIILLRSIPSRRRLPALAVALVIGSRHRDRARLGAAARP